MEQLRIGNYISINGVRTILTPEIFIKILSNEILFEYIPISLDVIIDFEFSISKYDSTFLKDNTYKPNYHFTQDGFIGQIQIPNYDFDKDDDWDNAIFSFNNKFGNDGIQLLYVHQLQNLYYEHKRTMLNIKEKV